MLLLFPLREGVDEAQVIARFGVSAKRGDQLAASVVGDGDDDGVDRVVVGDAICIAADLAHLVGVGALLREGDLGERECAVGSVCGRDVRLVRTDQLEGELALRELPALEGLGAADDDARLGCRLLVLEGIGPILELDGLARCIGDADPRVTGHDGVVAIGCRVLVWDKVEGHGVSRQVKRERADGSGVHATPEAALVASPCVAYGVAILVLCDDGAIGIEQLEVVIAVLGLVPELHMDALGRAGDRDRVGDLLSRVVAGSRPGRADVCGLRDLAVVHDLDGPRAALCDIALWRLGLGEGVGARLEALEEDGAVCVGRHRGGVGAVFGAFERERCPLERIAGLGIDLLQRNLCRGDGAVKDGDRLAVGSDRIACAHNRAILRDRELDVCDLVVALWRGELPQGVGAGVERHGEGLLAAHPRHDVAVRGVANLEHGALNDVVGVELLLDELEFVPHRAGGVCEHRAVGIVDGRTAEAVTSVVDGDGDVLLVTVVADVRLAADDLHDVVVLVAQVVRGVLDGVEHHVAFGVVGRRLDDAILVVEELEGELARLELPPFRVKHLGRLERD